MRLVELHLRFIAGLLVVLHPLQLPTPWQCQLQLDLTASNHKHLQGGFSCCNNRVIAAAAASVIQPSTQPLGSDAADLNERNKSQSVESGKEQSEVVNLLIELQKQIDAKTGYTHKKVEEESVDSILEGDIMLTVEQAKEIVQSTRRRRKRKLAEPLSKRWKLPIPYGFDGAHSDNEKRKIKQALAYWEDLTCIKFQENIHADFKLLFVRQRGCWSYVGYTRQPNQTISVGDGCQSNGTIAHEVGHAIGFWHEQSRPDRDLFVVIHEKNITEGKLYNFQTRTWGEIVIYDVPYDLGSGMHYGATFYAKDINGTLTTVETRDPLMMRVIGQRQELSFYDVKLANKAYCDGVCSSYGIRLSQPCKRDGYQDPKNCWQCRCPDGFGGNYCENIQPSVNAYCGGVLDAKYNGTVYSPNYLNPGYRRDVQCNWLIKAPEYYNVYLEFVDNFGITGHIDVCKDYVEVRYNSSLALTGARFCCMDRPSSALRSSTNEMLVLFRSFSDSLQCDDTKYPWKCKQSNIGFKARFYTKPCGGFGSRNAQPACIKRVSYVCLQMWEEKVKIECPKWWQSNSCGVRTVNKLRHATCYRDQLFCSNNFRLNVTNSMCTHKKQINSVLPNKDDDASANAVESQFPTFSTSDSFRAVRAPTNYVPTLRQLWSDWTSWGNCSRSCGGGITVRTRHCLTSGSCGNNNNMLTEKRPCSQAACFRKCLSSKTSLCDSWTTCTKMAEDCVPFCNEGFKLKSIKCVWNGTS